MYAFLNVICIYIVKAVMVVEVEGGGEGKNRHKKLFHVGSVKAESSEEEGEEEGDEREKTRYLHFFSISLGFLTFSLVRLFSLSVCVIVCA